VARTEDEDDVQTESATRLTPPLRGPHLAPAVDPLVETRGPRAARDREAERADDSLRSLRASR